MIGIVEIIFSLMMFCVIWFIAFKVKLRFDELKRLKNIIEKIEKQDKRYFTDGKEINLIEELGLKKAAAVVRTPVKKEKRKRRFFFFKRKKKEEKELEKLTEIKEQVPEVKEEKPKEEKEFDPKAYEKQIIEDAKPVQEIKAKPVKKDRREELRANLKEELRNRINKK